MKIILGPFHPQLEDAFVEAIQDFKSSDPLKPLLILVPSDALRRYLIRQLTLKHGLSLVNVSLLNFNQLSKTLYQAVAPAADLKLHDDLFFEEMLHLLLQEAGSDFSELRASEGGIGALWQTLRDLKEGLLDPNIALQALKEGHFGKGKGGMRGRLPRLFKRYRQVIKTCEKRQIFDYGEIASRAKHAIADDMFLKSFDAVFCYGFYDLTQVLVDLVHEVANFHSMTLFFPLVPGAPGWAFSERFFERYLAGFTASRSKIIDLTKNASPDSVFPYLTFFEENRTANLLPLPLKTDCRIVSCYDIHDEVLTVAKEILRLRSDGVLAFDEIGIVARDLDPYLRPLQNIFQKHAIPIASSAEVSLMQYPLAKSVFLMTTLLLQDFPRRACIDLMTSPFFNRAACCETASLLKPDDWDFLSRKAKITSGLNSWQKLVLGDKSASPDFSDQNARLWATFLTLYQDLSAFPKAALWSDYAMLWQERLEKYLGLLPLHELKEQDSASFSDSEQISSAISKILERLTSLGKISGQVLRDDFIAAFQRGLKKANMAFASHNIAGVSLMNIMQTRGISYRVLFVLGMNEGSFPRTIREDPFLVDHQRRVLETVLGYKVGEKLAGYDEEKLLFILAVWSATDQFYALYHRTDVLGGECAPSWYLGELKRVFQIEDETFIPRDLIARQLLSPFDQAESLLPAEWVIYLSLLGEDCEALLDQLPFSKTSYLRGKKALRRLEHEGPLSSFDGLISDASSHWEYLCEVGISPTALEAYALCPFQYYGKRLLNLSSEEDPEDEVLPKTKDIGTLCHEILKVFYEGLQSENDLSATLKNNRVLLRLKEISEVLFGDYASENPLLYPLHWEMQKTTILAMLKEVIEKDIATLIESGDRPAAFEVDCRQKIETEWPEFRGKIDRIDFNAEDGKARVVDYKITFRKNPLPLEKNLLTSALRAKKLQAPIYLKLAEVFVEAKAGSESGQCASVFYHLVPNWPDGPLVVSEFPASGWQGECGAMLKESITTLLQGIEKGRFFMKPSDKQGGHCDFCEVRPICRLNHLPSLKRLQRDVFWQEQEALQKLKAPKPPSKKNKANRA